MEEMEKASQYRLCPVRSSDKLYTSHGGLGAFNGLRVSLENGVQKVD